MGRGTVSRKMPENEFGEAGGGVGLLGNVLLPQVGIYN